jgi:hypothetical protein
MLVVKGLAAGLGRAAMSVEVLYPPLRASASLERVALAFRDLTSKMPILVPLSVQALMPAQASMVVATMPVPTIAPIMTAALACDNGGAESTSTLRLTCRCWRHCHGHPTVACQNSGESIHLRRFGP